MLLLGICAACLTPANENRSAEAVRIATYNVERLGAPGSDEWQALVAVLRRVDADVVLMQEVRDAQELASIGRLARESGYPHHAAGEVSGTLSGGLHAAALSRLPIRAHASYSAAELSGDPDANDITRDMFALAVDSPLGTIAALTTHLKAGGQAENRFRRQVEIERLLAAVALVRREHEGAHIVVAADFNETPRSRPGPREFRKLPGGLPRTYRLGADLGFPVVYRPMLALSDAGLERVEATQEDQPEVRITHPLTGRAIDMIWHSGTLAPRGALVYDGCDDDGVDAPPPGHFLELEGSPLDCAATQGASDHLPVVADFVDAQVVPGR